MTHRFIYDAGDNSGGGGLPPSMADLDQTALDGFTSGDGTQKPPDLAAEAAKAVADAEAKAKADATAGSGPIDGVNPDGTLQEGYVKNTDGTVSKIEPPVDDEPNNEPGDDAEQEDFWGAVEKITGTRIDVDYGSVDPVSPEGVALRDQALRKTTIEDWERNLQKADPRGYAFMVHRASGKPEEEFFANSTNTGYTLPEKNILEESADAQAALYRYDLKQRGLSDDIVDAVVAKAIKDNKLKELSLTAYTAVEKAQEDELKAIEDAATASQEKFNSAVTSVTSQLTSVIEKEIGFVVPETKRPEFRQYLLDNMRYQDGKFFFVQEVSGDALKNQVEGMFLQYNKGDLGKIIARSAKTVAAQRLRLGIDKNNSASKKNEGNNSGSSGYIPLGQI